jgi:2-dehydro-3-deoxygalactonokinase
MGEGSVEDDDRSAVCVDLGTTNTRVWLVQGERVVARAAAQVGVRDTARDGSSRRLRETLRDLITALVEDGQRQGVGPEHRGIIAAGMVSSSLGLAEVPHLPAPVGVADLAAAAKSFSFPDVSDLPVLLVPGVRTGTLSADPRAAGAADLMRGEETLCAGLVALGLARVPGVVLNLGSHWKTIGLDAQGRVAESVTSLSGEMIHAVQGHTILASALPSERPDALDAEWVHAGMDEQRRAGLGRALFCVRLLEQGEPRPAAPAGAARRMAYLVGAFIAADLDALTSRGVVRPDAPVTIVGHPALAAAWRDALADAHVPATTITEAQTEQALLAGLRQILLARAARGA